MVVGGTVVEPWEARVFLAISFASLSCVKVRLQLSTSVKINKGRDQRVGYGLMGLRSKTNYRNQNQIRFIWFRTQIKEVLGSDGLVWVYLPC